MENSKTINLQDGELISINGAIITPRVIGQIKSFQAHENEEINSMRDLMANASLKLLEMSDHFLNPNQEQERQEIIRLATDIGYYRKWFSNLAAPIDDDNKKNN